MKPVFEDFFRVELPRLIVFLVYQGAPSAAAEDAAQEAMVEAYRKWPEITTPRTWVRTVASRAWGRLLGSKGLPGELSNDAPHAAANAGPLEKVLQSEQHRDAIAAIQQLPARQRQVMAWTYDGFRPQEIAQILGITGDDVRANLYKARQTLRKTRGGAL
ncbi:hypothetical protein B1H26_21685 [Amycolatopsis sp. BJA-103]|nr:hypothetical protein B1H26_21685 [Amycolatopsis sp. BJA-103]